ncbi:MAG: ATP-binding cassette domain-containing protein, partial [Lachnospiraceae bacterium]|nr:ATP-binding cassette domain-containing protein [Lachnospiraceae bacterium]
RYESFPQGGETKMVREANENATDISGGEKQKLLFARALYKKAPLMILDEPTAALDPIAENELYLKYGEAAKNRTVVFISHRLSSTRFCDRIALLEGAQIIEEGTHEELILKNGRYAELFEMQSKYYREEEVG